MRSIRARLLVLLLSVTALVWIAVVARSYVDARAEVNRLFDAQLAQAAKMQLGAMQPVTHPYEQRLHFQIRDERGRLLYRSSADLPELELGGPGYFDATLHGVRWRVLVLRADGKEIEICQRYDVRERLAAQVARNMLWPLLLALPVLAALIWLATRQAIRPLSRVEQEFAGRAPDDLRPVTNDDAPRELVPLLDALNGLLERLHERFEVERRFTADAAHELRTPLAGLRAQTQVALAARGDSEREHALAQVLRGIDRTTHLIEQLLSLARLDPDHAEMNAERVDLASIASTVVAELAPQATAKNIDMSVLTAEPSIITGNPALIATLVRNLVENAIRYCNAGDAVRITVSHACIEVLDSGPGIPIQERERVFDRFHRGIRSESGSGLGLSIVRRITELHRGSVALFEGENGRGLRVTVRFPRD